MRNLAVATQAVTALFCEAMLASPGFIEPLIHEEARPHPGQVRVARMLRRLLEGSRMLRHQDESPARKMQELAGYPDLGELSSPEQGHYLHQDRYHLRTSPQVLGPALEDLEAAHASLEIELNSTTDNPLVDSKDGRVVHGGNFQGFSVTSAAEKVRDGASHCGRLLHDQLVEAIADTTNNALPLGLTLADCETDGGLRGLDIGGASYASELAFLASRANHFSRNAESGNQSINSMALFGARLALDSVEVLTTLVAGALYGACQAIVSETAHLKENGS